MQISRIRLSDKTAHLCTRKVIRSSPEPPHRAVLPRRAPTERSAHNRQCHHLGGHSLPGSQSGFFLHFSMWHLPQRLHVTGVSQGCPNLPCFATFSARLELRPLSSTGITRLPRYYGPFRHRPQVGRHDRPRYRASRVACVSLLCTCCRHYPGTGTGDTALLIPPVLSAFPAMAGRSACATSFSRIAQRSLALRPAHSPSHLMTLYTRGFSHFVTSMTAPIASGWSKIAGWDSHPLRNAAFARRTP